MECIPNIFTSNFVADGSQDPRNASLGLHALVVADGVEQLVQTLEHALS